MSRMIRFLDTKTTVLGPNRVEAIAGTSKRARDGHVVEMRGMDTNAFMRSGTILWSHDPERPVGVPASARVDSDGNLRLVIDFAPDGSSKYADEIRNLVKAGIVRNLSIGFLVIDAVPLDPKSPRGGQRVTRSELLEVSFVSVPSDTGAVVTARSGKVLSGGNADALREAHDLAERCRSTIADVLGGAGEAFGGGADAEAQRDHRRRQAEALRLAGVAHTHFGDANYERRQRQIAILGLTHVQHESDGEMTFAERQRRVRALSLPPWR